MADTKHVVLIPRAMDTEVIGPFNSYDEANEWVDNNDVPVAHSIEPLTPKEDYR